MTFNNLHHKGSSFPCGKVGPSQQNHTLLPIGTLGAFDLVYLGCEHSRLHFYQVSASRFKRGGTGATAAATPPKSVQLRQRNQTRHLDDAEINLNTGYSNIFQVRPSELDELRLADSAHCTTSAPRGKSLANSVGGHSRIHPRRSSDPATERARKAVASVARTTAGQKLGNSCSSGRKVFIRRREERGRGRHSGIRRRRYHGEVE